MHPKDAEGIVNSVDPDQTAPLGNRSSLIWVWTICLDLSVRKLRNITVVWSTVEVAYKTLTFCQSIMTTVNVLKFRTLKMTEHPKFIFSPHH